MGMGLADRVQALRLRFQKKRFFHNFFSGLTMDKQLISVLRLFKMGNYEESKN